MNNGFDKNAFQKKQGMMKRCCILIALLGIVSIVASPFVGHGFTLLNNIFESLTGSDDADEQNREFMDNLTPDEDDDFGIDPADYYGIYYAEKDFLIYQVEISADSVTLTMQTLYGETQTETLSYQYASAKYAQTTFSKNTPVILVYSGSLSNLNTRFWLESGSDGTYTLTSDNELTFRQTPITFDDLMNDPKNYLGTYYAGRDGVVDKLEIGESQITFTTSSVMVDDVQKTYSYRYVCAAFAASAYGRECDALVLYETDLADDTGVLWLSEEESGTVVIEGNNGLTYTADEITLSDLLGDPKNYYGTYAFSAQNTLTLYENGEAVFVLNGTATTYAYFYANNEWLTIHTTKNYDAAIVLYDTATESLNLFEVTASGDLIYADQYSFVKQ